MKNEDKAFIFPTSHAAGFFDITRKTLAQWTKAGCPKAGPGLYDLKAVFAWWQKNIMERLLASQDETITEAKRRYWKHKAGRESIKEKHEEGQLIPLAKAIQLRADMASKFVQGLELYAYRLPPILEGKSKLEMRELIKAENRLLRLGFLGKSKSEKEKAEKK